MTESPLSPLVIPPAVGMDELERIVRDLNRRITILERDSGWVNMQCLNGWVNYDSGLSIGGVGRIWRVRRIGMVCFSEGVTRSGTVGSVMGVLPYGFRQEPRAAYERATTVNSNNGLGFTNQDAATGNIVHGGGVNAFQYMTDVWVAAS